MSAFRLLERFARGEDIVGFLRAYGQHGFNLVRVFNYTPAKDWKERAWEPQGAAVVRAFCLACAAEGFFVELTLLTDDDAGRVDWAFRLADALGHDDALGNLVIEIGNEPQTHKDIRTHAIAPAFRQSSLLYSSGDYEQNGERWFGSYFTIHTPRDGDWPRKAHDLLEQREGHGPATGSQRAIHVPIVSDEPIRPDQAGFNADDFYAYAAACSLFGAGATFHSESGKLAELPTAAEENCAVAFAAGLRVFPADAPLGAYDRIDEHGATLRTYTVGNYMVRVRPKTPTAPEAGWTPLDEFGVCWRRA